MTALHIRLFGTLEIERGSNRLGPFPTQKSRSLFAYLVVNRNRSYSRETLAGTFWGEKPDRVARKGLRTELWRARRVIEGGAENEQELLSLREEHIEFKAGADCWIDVAEFENRVIVLQNRPAGELTGTDVARLREAVALYRGDVLEDLYDDWCLYVRERLRLLQFNALTQLLAHSMLQSEWAAAIQYGERLLNGDPLLEHVHRSLMRCHCSMGNRASALRQFALCQGLLRAELQVTPMRETIALVEKIRGEGTPANDALELPATRGPGEGEDHFEAADRYVRRAHRQLRRGMQAARQSRG